MWKKGLTVLLCFTAVFSKQHIIKSIPKLRQQGYHEDIDLGEVITEAVVDSPEACGRLCEKNPACHSVMLMGQLCKMFSISTCRCSTALRPIAGSTSRYWLGHDAHGIPFQSAMAKCLSLGAHSVHINSQEEHDVIKQFLWDSGMDCTHVWTGGRSHVAGSTDITDWRWYYTNNFTGPSEPFTYLGWGAGQPNNYEFNQFCLGLSISVRYDFNDIAMTYPADCYFCECP